MSCRKNDMDRLVKTCFTGCFGIFSKGLAYFFVGVLGVLLLGASANARVWHVCMRCEDRDSQTITEALRRAEPKDTILVYWEPGFPYYMDHLVIDKPVRIISNVAAGDIMNYDLYPVITSASPEIVHITVPGVELIGFNIMYLQKPSTCEDETACYSSTVGIRLSAPAVIRQCAITNCHTGILTAYDYSHLNSGSTITQCRIGLPPDHGVSERGFSETLNHYGLVLLGCRQDGIGLGTGSDRISQCQVMKNTQYGLVYTPNNEPNMSGNLIEFNGLGPFRVVRPDLDQEKHLIWFDEPVKTETEPAKLETEPAKPVKPETGHGKLETEPAKPVKPENGPGKPE